jgi:para-aminobenzoate synthetase component 1
MTSRASIVPRAAGTAADRDSVTRSRRRHRRCFLWRRVPTEIVADTSRAAYLAAVERVHEHILAGDVYQVNLSQRFRAELVEPAFALYRRVRARRPAPLGAYFEYGPCAVLSNSPELFLSVRGREVETRPIKGTRPRGVDPRR